MRHIVIAVLTLSLLVSLSGCGNSLPGGQTEATTQPSTAQETVQGTEIPVPETTVSTTEPPIEPARTLPYLVTVPRADFPFHQGPGYHTPQTGRVELAGVYTIVEEAYDDSGNLWGKLKSGAGWLDLTRLKKEETDGPVISMSSMAELLSGGGDYIYCPIAFDQYARKIYLKANVPLTNVEIFPLNVFEEQIEQPTVYTVASWGAGEFLLLEASFPGDFSAYGIRVTDSDGVIYRYSIWENLSGEGEPFSLNTYAP